MNIRHINKILQNKKLNILEKIEEFICSTYFYDRMSTYYYNVKNFLLNTPFFLKQAWNFRPWDYNYNINLFVDSLEKTALNIKTHGHFVGSEKTARRCFTAAKKLRSAYDVHITDDKTIEYLFNRNPICWQPINKNFYEMKHTYKTSERIYEGMYKAATKRKEKEIKELKKEAWEYIHKYIERFWD